MSITSIVGDVVVIFNCQVGWIQVDMAKGPSRIGLGSGQLKFDPAQIWQTRI